MPKLPKWVRVTQQVWSTGCVRNTLLFDVWSFCGMCTWLWKLWSWCHKRGESVSRQRERETCAGWCGILFLQRRLGLSVGPLIQLILVL